MSQTLPNAEITRIPHAWPGRVPGTKWRGLISVAAVAPDDSLGFADQCRATFARLDLLLGQLQSSKRSILSAAIHITTMENKAEFDRLWLEWIGDNPECWPQRTCVQGGLAARYLVEIQLTAVEEQPA